MPQDFDKPFRIKDLTTPKDIAIKTELEYTDENLSAIADADEDVPDNARIYGISGITGTIGSSGTIVKVKSSSASDTAGAIIRVEGWLDASKTIKGFENITISTSTPTTFVSGTTTFYGITHLSKSADTTGYVTVADSSDTTLAILQDVDRVSHHKVLKLGKIPDDAYDYRVWYKRKVRKMVNDYDYPFIDVDSYFLLAGWGWALNQDKETMERAAVVWGKAKDALMALLSNIQGNLGEEHQHKIEAAFIQAHRA